MNLFFKVSVFHYSGGSSLPHQKNLVSLIRQFTKSVNRCFHAVNLCLVFDIKVSSIPDDNGLSFALLRACVNSVTLGSCSQTLDS